MHQVHLEDQLYRQAQRRAAEAGFNSVDEYVADVICFNDTATTENQDHLFTPEVVNDLDRVAEAVKAGGKTFSPDEVREHFRKRSEAWRANRTAH